MDKEDLLILSMLKEGKAINEIQKKLGVSRQSVYYRIQKLKKDVGLKETINVDFEKIGYGTIILCLIKWDFKNYEEIWTFGQKYILGNPHICLYTILLGDLDGIAIFACRSQTEYYDEVLHPILTYGGHLIKEWNSIPVTKLISGHLSLPNVLESLSKAQSKT